MGNNMDRLVFKTKVPFWHGWFYIANVSEVNDESMIAMQDVLKKLYNYEQEEINGTIKHLPCKIGDKVFIIKDEKIIEAEVMRIKINERVTLIGASVVSGDILGKSIYFDVYDFGGTVFLSKRKAEKELNRGKIWKKKMDDRNDYK